MTSKRTFWWPAATLTQPWKPCYFAWHGEENCNTTFGLRLPGGVLFVCLNVPLRQEPCAAFIEATEWP